MNELHPLPQLLLQILGPVLLLSGIVYGVLVTRNRTSGEQARQEITARQVYGGSGTPGGGRATAFMLFAAGLVVLAGSFYVSSQQEKSADVSGGSTRMNDPGSIQDQSA